MNRYFLFCAMGLVGLVSTVAFAQTESDRIVQRGLEFQKLGKDGDAFRLFQMAADMGNAQGQYRVGYCYFSGQGTRLDQVQARQWFLKAASQGDGRSEKYLGNIYENGWGVAADADAAKTWYHNALEHGCPSAKTDLDRLENVPTPVSTESPQVSLADSSNAGTDVSNEWVKKGKEAEHQRNWSEAFQWFQKAADAGNFDGEIELGGCYQMGLGVPLNFKKMIYWTKKAADAGSPKAQTKMGFIYYQGQGVKVNFKTAVSWWQKAADQDYPEAEKALGSAYENGEGVPKDMNKAKEWYDKAGVQGFSTTQN